MLPEKHDPADVEFITEQLSKLNYQLKGRVLIKYSTAYTEAYDSEPVDHKKANAARREANIRLRNFVDHYAAASLGVCVQPPTV